MFHKTLKLHTRSSGRLHLAHRSQFASLWSIVVTSPGSHQPHNSFSLFTHLRKFPLTWNLGLTYIDNDDTTSFPLHSLRKTCILCFKPQFCFLIAFINYNKIFPTQHRVLILSWWLLCAIPLWKFILLFDYIVEHWPCARYYSRHWSPSSEWDGHALFSGGHSLIGKPHYKQVTWQARSPPTEIQRQ